MQIQSPYFFPPPIYFYKQLDVELGELEENLKIYVKSKSFSCDVTSNIQMFKDTNIAAEN